MSDLQESQAFTAMIIAHQALIHKVCGIYTEHPEDRRDLFQDIVLQLWRARESWRGEAKLSTWMYRVALNTAISRFRKEKRLPRHQDITLLATQLADTAPDPDLDEKRTMLYKAINHLSEVEKGVTMLYLEEHSYEEISEIIGITPNHVGVLINRIKAKLRKILSPHLS
ncbi:MAG: sigma-70 family RNA polymerase sigma factor [Bacteroidia bacterium]|nr:sigma-70 family RNA polymerase sigma factor [Bacteroidia bacterium]